MSQALPEIILPYKRVMILSVASLFSGALGALFGLMHDPKWILFTQYATLICIVIFAMSFLYFGRGALLGSAVLGTYLAVNTASFDIFFTGLLIAGAISIVSGIWLGHITYKNMIEKTVSQFEVSIGLILLISSIIIAVSTDLFYL